MSASIGNKLQQIRKEKGISLEEISKHTRIRLPILQSLEDNDYTELPSYTQVRGFLKLFASYLKVDLNSIILEIQEDGLSQSKYPESLLEIDQQESIILNPDTVEAVVIDDSTSQIEDLVILEENHENFKGSKIIFLDIGKELKERRDLLEISLEEIEEQLHINKEYLQMLENGDINTFSSSIQTKGYLKNYAKFLSLDLETILPKYADGLQLLRQENMPKQTKDSHLYNFALPYLVNLKKYFTLDLLFGTLLVVGIVGFLIWGTINMIKATRDQEDLQDLPEIAEILITAPFNQEEDVNFESASLTEIPETQVVQEPTPIFTPVPNLSAIQLVIVAEKDAWVRVTTDGKSAFEGRVLPGNAYSFSAEMKIDILTGNAAALQFYFNDSYLGSLGLAAQVLQVSFDTNGLVRPTATPTLGGTATPIQINPSQTPENP